ncbi:membrane associated ring-CH-type finger 4 [Brienomyrus brachyistius]|uniref:membrane associated ring-CH-type finger 4 n=1 Tax=Brienomyrus brachyistius TaxID=42636 RepID=UPI0020B248D4|nr:membrane associated ring-CH-type finger 4 [Brienomyrus brachyistius]XP_048857814.1 membrane associated ring-CH-type finger 4 [Brienomyrus brachyistius]
MLLIVGVIVWCWGLLSHRQMLRHQGMVKSRCCVLFSDLKVFLLRPPGPPASQPSFLPMSGPDTETHANEVADNNNTLINAPQADGWTAPPAESATADDASGGAEGWSSSAAERSATLDCSSSSDELAKEKSEERLSLSSCTDSGVRTPLCRICFQGPEQGELLSPCRCSGSVRCTHQPCLIKWISERGSWSCELCYYKYQVIAISTKNPLQWQAISLTVIEKVQMAAALLGSLFLIASVSWLIWSSLSPSAKWQRQDLLFQICYGMYGFMDVVCIALIIHEGPSVYRIFNRWQAVNQQWKVLNYDKVKDCEDQKASTSTRTLFLPTQRGSSETGQMLSASTSSLMNAAMAPVGTPTPRATATPVGLTSQDSSDQSNGPPSLPDHHCAYNILHLLSHLRQQESRGQANSGNRELVMRVTTV